MEESAHFISSRIEHFQELFDVQDGDLGILVYPVYDVDTQTYDMDIHIRDTKLHELEKDATINGDFDIGYNLDAEHFLDVVYPSLVDYLEEDFPDSQVEYTDPDILPR